MIRYVPTARLVQEPLLCSSIYTEIDGHIRIRSLPCEIASIIQMLINPNRLKHTISLDCIHTHTHTYTMVYIEYFSCICYRARALYHLIWCPHVVCASCAVVFIDFGASLFACSTQGTSPYTRTHAHTAGRHTCVVCVCVLDFAIYALIFICHIVLFARDL